MSKLTTEAENKILRILVQYLLMERRQETELSMAYSILVQERHNQFHTKSGDRKLGDGSDYCDCANELCQASFKILKGARSMATEVNDLTIQLVSNYDLTIQYVGTSCRAWLSEKLMNATQPKVVLAEGVQ